MSKKLVALVLFCSAAFSDVCALEDSEVRKSRAEICNSVVRISVDAFKFNWLEPYCAPQESSWTGSGFFINEDGDFLTNYHIVEQARGIRIQISSIVFQSFPAEVIGVSPERDLALMRLTDKARDDIRKILGAIPFLPFGDSDKVSRGDGITLLGYPLGQQYLKITQGIVSGMGRPKPEDSHSFLRILCFQTDAAANGGSSGGCLLNDRGEVLGVLFCGCSEARNIGYTLPINALRNAIEEMREVKISRVMVPGISVCPCNEDMAIFLGNPEDGGMFINAVAAGSSFEKIGIRKGDVIYEINGYKLDFYGAIVVPWSEDKISTLDFFSRSKRGDGVLLTVFRNGVRHKFSFEIGQSDLFPIRQMYPEYEAIDYEIFGGMVFMNLTLNYIDLAAKHVPELRRYASIGKRHQPAIVITRIVATSPAARLDCAVTTGSIVEEVNGEKVKDLDGLRKALRKSFDTKFVTILADDKRYSVFSVDSILKDEKRLASICQYPLSPFVKELYDKQPGAAAA